MGGDSPSSVHLKITPFWPFALTDIAAVTNLSICPWAHMCGFLIWLLLEICGPAQGQRQRQEAEHVGLMGISAAGPEMGLCGDGKFSCQRLSCLFPVAFLPARTSRWPSAQRPNSPEWNHPGPSKDSPYRQLWPMKALVLQHLASLATACRLSCPVTWGILVPQPGIKPKSPALGGRFLTTGPPRKSLVSISCMCVELCHQEAQVFRFGVGFFQCSPDYTFPVSGA